MRIVASFEFHDRDDTIRKAVYDSDEGNLQVDAPLYFMELELLTEFLKLVRARKDRYHRSKAAEPAPCEHEKGD